jgi:hypothetical protein
MSEKEEIDREYIQGDRRQERDMSMTAMRGNREKD